MYISRWFAFPRILRHIAGIQNLYDKKGAMKKSLPHLATRCEEVAKEVLGFLCIMLFNANTSVQVRVQIVSHKQNILQSIPNSSVNIDNSKDCSLPQIFMILFQQAMLDYFLSTREEVFFMAVRDRMALSTNSIKEKYEHSCYRLCLSTVQSGTFLQPVLQ